MDLTRFKALSFDCYGTLIDWETGISALLGPWAREHGVDAGEEALLLAYGDQEAAVEHDTPAARYPDVIAEAFRRMGASLGAPVSDEWARRLGESVPDWPAFPDSAEALGRLQRRFKLAPITNCDDDLFARSAERLGVDFDWVITAQQAQCYKPSRGPFDLAFETIDAPRERILHVAQSLFHDHVTAKELGMTTVWIDRRGDRAGSGATPPAEARPDLRLPDMRSLADMAEA